MFRSSPPVISLQTFIKAACEGRYNQIQLYLMRNKEDAIAVNAARENGNNALMMAAKYNHPGIVTTLCHLPVTNVNAANYDGNTPLMFAVMHGHIQIVKLLLSVPGINVNAVNQDGFSALSRAAMFGHAEIVKLLLAIPDINLSIRNIFNRNAAEEAIARSQPECARLIYEAATAANKALPRDPLICPLSLASMNDPVTVSSGATYERNALQAYFDAHPEAETFTCVINGKQISRSELSNATNYAIKRLIVERQLRNEYYPEFQDPEFDGSCTML